MSWNGIELMRTKSGVKILRHGTGVELSLDEIRWLVRNIPVILKVGDGECMLMSFSPPQPKKSKKS